MSEFAAAPATTDAPSAATAEAGPATSAPGGPKKGGKKGADTTPAPRFGRVKANLKMGILGLPNVGKSSLFNLMTEQAVAAENYPFCTIEPNESRCPIPDQRFDWLCNLWQPASIIPAYLHITDIAGLIRGASGLTAYNIEFELYLLPFFRFRGCWIRKCISESHICS
jgi:hypothetical protein